MEISVEWKLVFSRNFVGRQKLRSQWRKNFPLSIRASSTYTRISSKTISVRRSDVHIVILIRDHFNPLTHTSQRLRKKFAYRHSDL